LFGTFVRVRRVGFPARGEFRLSQEVAMSVAKVTEISCSSRKSFDDAIAVGMKRANKTLRNVKGAWVSGMKVECEGGKITEYRVNLRVTFVLAD